MCRVPSDCRGVSVASDGRREIQPCLAAAKLVYEALMRQVWSGFQKWVAEKHDEKTSLVDEMFSGLQSLRDNVCKSEFQKKLCKNSFAEVAKLFERYMSFLRCENGKLSEFWVSYLDLVDILLAMKRASREGDWDLPLSSISNLIPWCFAYDNVNYARYLSSYL